MGTTSTRGSKRWRYSALGSIVLSPDFYVGVPLGFAAASGALVNDQVVATLPSLMVGVAGVGAAVTTLVLTSITVFLSLATPSYRAILALTPGGMKGATKPFLWVAGLSVAATAMALIAAGWLPAFLGVRWLVFLAAALPMASLLWSVMGCAQLAGQLVMHLENHAKAEEFQKRREAAERQRRVTAGR